MTPRQTLTQRFSAGKPANFESLLTVYTAIIERPNLMQKQYLTITGLSDKTFVRCYDTLVEKGLVIRGPVVDSSIRNFPIPPLLKQGFIPDWGNFPATHMAYYFAQFDVDAIPPGFQETVAVYGNWVGSLLGEDENRWKMFSCFLQEMLAVAAIGSLNFALFQNPKGPIDLPEDPDEAVLHCIKVIRQTFGRYLDEE